MEKLYKSFDENSKNIFREIIEEVIPNLSLIKDALIVHELGEFNKVSDLYGEIISSYYKISNEINNFENKIKLINQFKLLL